MKAFAYRRVKNDFRDAADLADLLRMGRLPEAWIAPPQVRDLRQLVRHRAKLVAVRTGWKCQVHAVLAACGVPVRMSDLFGEAGTELLDHLQLPTAFAARVNSLRRLLEPLDAEIALFGAWSRPGWPAIAATGRSSHRPGSVRCWRRCWSPRSATSAASRAPPSWPAGSG